VTATGVIEMKRLAAFIIVCAVVLVSAMSGRTMAWFSSTSSINSNQFTAGTVDLSIDENGFTNATNWNPGDKTVKNVDVVVDSSKQTYIRVLMTPVWADGLPLDKVTLNFSNISGDTNWVFSDGTPVPTTITAGDFVRKITSIPDGHLYYKIIVSRSTNPRIDLLEAVEISSSSNNSYQNDEFSLTITSEGVQASHYAFRDVWGINATALVPAPGVQPSTNVP